MSAPPQSRMQSEPSTRKQELRAFLFLTAVLVPALAVALVGTYGLAIWIYQMIAGPPTG
jgi:periplasmic nitrate reductase NapE